MRKRWFAIFTAVAVMFLSCLSGGRAFAAEYPQVGNLKPFSEEANFMSLAGYLRFLVFQQDGTWISRDEAERIVRQQQGR